MRFAGVKPQVGVGPGPGNVAPRHCLVLSFLAEREEVEGKSCVVGWVATTAVRGPTRFTVPLFC